MSRRCSRPPDGHDEEMKVTKYVLAAVVKDLPTEKAPRPDGIPNVALKPAPAVLENPEMFRTTIQERIPMVVFPTRQT